MLAALNRHRPGVTVESLEDGLEVITIKKATIVMAKRGPYTAFLSLPVDRIKDMKALVEIINAFKGFTKGGQPLSKDPEFRATFADAMSGGRLVGYASTKRLRPLLENSPLSPTDIDYYIARFPSMGGVIGGEQLAMMLRASVKGQGTLAKLFKAKKVVALSRFIGKEGWSAQRVSINLDQFFEGVVELLPPSQAGTRAGIGTLPALLETRTGSKWSDLAAAFSGQVLMGMSTRSGKYLAIIGLNDPKKAASLLDKLIKKAQADGPTKPRAIDQDGLVGYEIQSEQRLEGAIGGTVIVRYQDALLVASSLEEAKAAVARSKGENLASTATGKWLDSENIVVGSFIDLESLGKAFLSDSPLQISPQLKRLKMIPEIEKALETPLVLALTLNDGLRLSSEGRSGVLALIGVGAAVAIPAFVNYRKRARVSEAAQNIRMLYDASVSYFNTEAARRDGTALPRQFPVSATLTPGNPTKLMCKNGKPVKYVPTAKTWSQDTWHTFNFSIDEPFYYAYEYVSKGTEAGSAFTVRAIGDLDCDGILSTFERVGTADSSRRVTGAVFTNNEME